MADRSDLEDAIANEVAPLIAEIMLRVGNYAERNWRMTAAEAEKDSHGPEWAEGWNACINSLPSLFSLWAEGPTYA